MTKLAPEFEPLLLPNLPPPAGQFTAETKLEPVAGDLLSTERSSHEAARLREHSLSKLKVSSDA